MIRKSKIRVYLNFMLCFALLFTQFVVFVPEASAATLQTFHVSGNKIVNESNVEKIFKGVSIQDPLEQDHINEFLFDEMAAWGVQLVRLPIRPERYHIVDGRDKALQIIENCVQMAADRGMYCIIDYHVMGSVMTGYVAESGYGSTQAQFNSFWTDIANKYKNDNRVAFYELLNEHVTKERSWEDTEQEWIDYRNWAEQGIDLIRNIDPNKIIMVGGNDWSGNLRYVGNNPIRRNNIVYTIHPYPMKQLSWDTQWGYVKNTYPVMATELGYLNGVGSIYDENEYTIRGGQGTYHTELQNYMNSKGVSWTAWVFGTTWIPTLIEDYSGNVTEEGSYYREQLLGFSPTPKPTPAPVAESASVIKNGEFDNGMANWSTWNEASTSVSYNVVQDANMSGTNALYANVTNGGGTSQWENWKIVLEQNAPLEVGVYQYVFRAKAATNNRFIHVLNEDSSNVKNSDEYFKLSTTMKPYVMKFRVTSATSTNKMKFCIGGFNSAVWIDSVSLVKLDGSTTPTPEATPTPTPSGSANLVQNGEFDSNLTSWWTYTDGTASATHNIVTNASMSGSKAYYCDVSNGSDGDWKIQLAQDIPCDSSKTYTLSFKAKAQANRTIKYAVQKNGSPFTTYYSQDFNITTEAQTYTCTYTPSGTDSAAAIRFWMGANSNDVWIDEVSLTNGSGGATPTPTTTPTPTPSGTKYEAETGTRTNSARVESSAAASGGQHIGGLDNGGSSVELTSGVAGTQIVLRYCSMNTGKISLYINGVHNQDVNFTSTGSWTSGYTDKTVNATVASGGKIKVQFDSGDSALNLDYIVVK